MAQPPAMASPNARDGLVDRDIFDEYLQFPEDTPFYETTAPPGPTPSAPRYHSTPSPDPFDIPFTADHLVGQEDHYWSGGYVGEPWLEVCRRSSPLRARRPQLFSQEDPFLSSWALELD